MTFIRTPVCVHMCVVCIHMCVHVYNTHIHTIHYLYGRKHGEESFRIFSYLGISFGVEFRAQAPLFFAFSLYMYFCLRLCMHVCMSVVKESVCMHTFLFACMEHACTRFCGQRVRAYTMDMYIPTNLWPHICTGMHKCWCTCINLQARIPVIIRACTKAHITHAYNIPLPVDAIFLNAR